MYIYIYTEHVVSLLFYLYLHVDISIYLCLHTYISLYLYMYVSIYLCIYSDVIFISVNVYVCVCVYIYTCCMHIISPVVQQAINGTSGSGKPALESSPVRSKFTPSFGRALLFLLFQYPRKLQVPPVNLWEYIGII